MNGVGNLEFLENFQVNSLRITPSETAVETPWPKGVANHFLTHLPMEADLYNVRTRTGSELYA